MHFETSSLTAFGVPPNQSFKRTFGPWLRRLWMPHGTA
jgi:hypothetical protein